jgi:hypothetical protein
MAIQASPHWGQTFSAVIFSRRGGLFCQRSLAPHDLLHVRLRFRGVWAARCTEDLNSLPQIGHVAIVILQSQAVACLQLVGPDILAVHIDLVIGCADQLALLMCDAHQIAHQRVAVSLDDLALNHALPIIG